MLRAAPRGARRGYSRVRARARGTVVGARVRYGSRACTPWIRLPRAETRRGSRRVSQCQSAGRGLGADRVGGNRHASRSRLDACAGMEPHRLAAHAGKVGGHGSRLTQTANTRSGSGFISLSPAGGRVKGEGNQAPLSTLTPTLSLKGRGAEMRASPLALTMRQPLPIRG